MDIPLIPGTLAQDCYPASANAFQQEIINRAHGVIPDITGILIQDAAPDPIYRGNKGWIPTSGGVPIYPGYVFIWHATVGHWVSRHPLPASDPRPQMYIGDLADLPTFDGGDANSPTIASGPMWEQWTAITGRVPVGVGLIPGSSPAATITTVLDTQDSLGNSGEYKHVLTAAEGAVGDHVHPMGVTSNPGGTDFFFPFVSPPVPTANWNGAFVGGDDVAPTAETTANLFTLQANNGNGATAVGHNNMMPYIGVYWIKRTARQFYVLG